LTFFCDKVLKWWGRMLQLVKHIFCGDYLKKNPKTSVIQKIA